jgi:hypothetical protein
VWDAVRWGCKGVHGKLRIHARGHVCWWFGFNPNRVRGGVVWLQVFCWPGAAACWWSIILSYKQHTAKPKHNLDNIVAGFHHCWCGRRHLCSQLHHRPSCGCCTEEAQQHLPGLPPSSVGKHTCDVPRVCHCDWCAAERLAVLCSMCCCCLVWQLSAVGCSGS